MSEVKIILRPIGCVVPPHWDPEMDADWEIVGAVSQSAAVNEEVADDDVSYLRTHLLAGARYQANCRVLFFFPNHGTASGSITNVRLCIVTKDTTTAGNIVGQFCPVMNDAKGDGVMSSSEYYEHQFNHPTNPATSTSWTWNDIDVLTAGVLGSIPAWSDDTYSVRVTQLYLEITYNSVVPPVAPVTRSFPWVGKFKLCRVITSRAGAMGWTERLPAGDVRRTWSAIASDAPGSHLLAVVMGSDGITGYVWVSTDGGAGWTQRDPASHSEYWISAASDADGSNLVVAAWAGDIYTSTDYGATWTKRQPTGGIQNWNFVCSDDDGSNLMAGVSSGRLWTSANGGVTWTERRPAGNYNRDWRCGACNADGSILIAGDYTPGRLWKSTDSGVTWTELRPTGNYDKSWSGIACDADASNLIATDDLRLYTSSNGGTDWVERQPIGDVDASWNNVASDDDGSNLIAEDTARIYTSADSGATWTEQQPAGNIDAYWACCSNADGSHLVVANYAGGSLYTLP